MARIEVEEADLAASQGVVAVVNQIMKNPKARTMLLRARKEADPSVSIPELDAADPINNAVEDVRKELAALRAEREADKLKVEEDAKIRAFTAKWDEQADQLRREGWRMDGLEKIREFAMTNQIPNLIHAAAAWERENPAPDPATQSSGMWSMFDAPGEKDTFVEDMMKTKGESNARLDQEIQKVLAEVRSAR